MRAFVAGATGYVGGAVVDLLAARGVETWAHVRPDSSRLDEQRKRFEGAGAHVDTTPWDLDAMAARFAELRPDVVFGCIGTTRARKRAASDPSKETYEAIDYGLTSILISASAALEEPPRFCYLSSAGTAPNTGSSYLAARWKAEGELRDSGLPFTIARPAFISGPNREENRPGERFGAIVSDAVLNAAAAVGMRNLRDRWASLTNDELAAALVHFALDPDGANRILDAHQLRVASKTVQGR